MLKKKGFTLIELVIVVVIVTIIALFALVRYGNVAEKARSAEAYAVLSDIAASESGYYIEWNGYNTTWSALDRYSSAPISNNFTYNLASNYGKATATTGVTNYCMGFNGVNIACP